MSQGKVYLVGAGPGALDLITLRGYQLIQRADVILHDHLIAKELLLLAGENAEIISVGKFAGRHTIPQSQINKLLVEKAKSGKAVVRLKGGDPYLFGRGGEEAASCVDAGVDFEVVPGLTSALAGPCFGGIPPTHRDYTSNVAIVTGHRKKDDLEIEIPKAGTIIFLMGVSNIERIVNSLLKDGWPNETKIAAIENATSYNQRVIKGNLDNFLQIVQQAKLQTPAVFIVGRIVELQEKLDWFGKKPNVLVLGNYPEKYKRLGNIVHRRIIDCVPFDDYSKVDTVVQKIENYDWIIFTSANGVKYLSERLYAMGKDARAFCNSKIAAIGTTTAQRLREFGITADIVPGNESSVGLLEEFAAIDMKGKKVLLPQSEIASDELSDGLLGMQAVIEKLSIYKTVDIKPEPVDFNFIDIILFTSGSTVRAFVKHFGKVPENVKTYCLGQPTLNEAKKHNINAEIIPG